MVVNIHRMTDDMIKSLPYEQAREIYERVYLAEQKAMVNGTSSRYEYNKIIEEEGKG